MEASKFCINDGYALVETTASGKLHFICTVCGNIRESIPEETLLYEIQYGKTYVSEHIDVNDIAEDEICYRTEVDCKCGCRVANVVVDNKTMRAIKICLKCHEQV